jgi:hypothetical protein
MTARGVVAGLVLALILAGCAPQATGPVPPEQLAARLPADLIGFRRGAIVPLTEGGVEVGFSTMGRTSAGSTVEINRPDNKLVADGAGGPQAGAALVQALAEATLPAPNRQVSETGRFTLPAGGPPGLLCAETAGRYGRERVRGLLCEGGVRGNLVSVRLTMPDRDPPPADPRAFATALLAALLAP